MPDGPGDDVDDVDDLDDDPAGTPPAPDDDDVDGSGTPPDGDDEPTEDPHLLSLREKYPGLSDDQINARVRADYWDQTRALSKLTKAQREQELELARMKGRFEAGTPPAKEEPAQLPPEVQELDTKITSLTERDAAIYQEQLDLLKELNAATEKIGEFKGLIAAAKADGNEDKQERAEVRLEGVEREQKAIRREIDSKTQRRKDLGWDVSRLKRERSWMVTVAEQGKARAESERQKLDEELEAIPQRVDGLIENIIGAALGAPDAKKNDAALREDLRETLRDKITIDLWKAGGDVPISDVNVPGLLQKHTERYMKAHGIAKRATFADGSRRKAAVSGAGTHTPGPAPKPGDGKRPSRSAVVSATGELSPGMLRARRVLERRFGG